jgi:hypothetical protein
MYQPKSGQAALLVRFLDYTKWNTHTHARAVGLLWTSEELVAKVTTYPTNDKHKAQTTLPSAGFKPVTSAIQSPQTYALDGRATGIDQPIITTVIE